MSHFCIRFRKFFLALCFLILPTDRGILIAADIPASSTSTIATNCPKKISLLKRSLRFAKDFAIASALIGFITIEGVHIYHDTEAAAQGKEHIGSAIYLDIDVILSLLPPEIQALTQKTNRTKEDDIRIIKALTKLLSEDYDTADRPPKFFPKPRDASTYCQGGVSTLKRGVCRQKAEVLVAAANKLGIEGVVEVSLWTNAHAWGWFPKLQRVGDPVSSGGQVFTREEFYKHHQNLGADFNNQMVGPWAYHMNRALGGIVR